MGRRLRRWKVHVRPTKMSQEINKCRGMCSFSGIRKEKWKILGNGAENQGTKHTLEKRRRAVE